MTRNITRFVVGMLVRWPSLLDGAASPGSAKRFPRGSSSTQALTRIAAELWIQRYLDPGCSDQSRRSGPTTKRGKYAASWSGGAQVLTVLLPAGFSPLGRASKGALRDATRKL
jgi:hypothetical protein